ncbi:hypothetical protein [Azospirillum endophyticum]
MPDALQPKQGEFRGYHRMTRLTQESAVRRSAQPVAARGRP